jgi:hypothetical protein
LIERPNSKALFARGRFAVQGSSLKSTICSLNWDDCMSARAAVTATQYGEVDTAALETLQSGYDTMRLLDAVDARDDARTGLYAAG